MVTLGNKDYPAIFGTTHTRRISLHRWLMAVFTPNLTRLPLSEERTALAHEKVMAFG